LYSYGNSALQRNFEGIIILGANTKDVLKATAIGKWNIIK